VAYGDGLENRSRRKASVGSNPTPSAYPERSRKAYWTWSKNGTFI
jgi:hypothetical protein